MKKSSWIFQFTLINLFVICEILRLSAMGAVNISQIQFGFNNHYKRNRWAPLQLRIETADEEFNGTVEVEVKNIFAGVGQKYSKFLTLHRKAMRNLYFYVFPSGITSQFTIRLIDSEGVEKAYKEFTPEIPKRRQDFLVLALASNADALSNLTGEKLKDSRNLPDSLARTIYVVYLAGRMNLPDNWKGYDSIDLVVIRDISLEPHNISYKQQTALTEWIYSGGTLLISGGNNIQYLKGSFLEPLLPVTSMQLKIATSPPALTKLFNLPFDSQYRFELINSALKEGSRSLVAENKTPIIAEREIGDGKIVFLAFDYSISNFTGQGRKQLWNWLLNDVVQSKLKRESVFDPYRRHETRIRRLLSSVPKNRSPLIGFVGLFLAAYTIGFGLFMYIFAKRAKTAKTVWFGGLCVIFIFTAILPGLNYVMKGDLRVYSFSIVNIYPEFSRARLETYLGLLSSDNSKCNLQSENPPKPPPSPLFQRGEGGISKGAFSKLFIRRLDDAPENPYEFVQTKKFQYRGIQLNPWTTQTFHAESYIKLLGRISSDLHQSDGIVAGTIKNNLPFDLSNSYLTYRDFYDEIGDFPKGAEVSVRVDSKYSSDIPKAIYEASVQSNSGERGVFARILAGEGVLKYLAQPAQPKLIGWTKSTILNFDLGKRYATTSQTIVIIHLRITI